MYTKFNYSPSGYFYNHEINRHLSNGNKIFSAHEKEVQKCLSQYITEDGIINGTDLKEHWFSITKKDIFISHSHCDINKVKAFAGWLHDCFGLEAFIDSCSWGYCDDLLNKIDKKYCYDSKKKTYDYHLRNYTTSHVHMMLSTARANTVFEYLVNKKHMKPKETEIEISGMGEYEPVASNKTRKGRAQNRRVEIKIYTSK